MKKILLVFVVLLVAASAAAAFAVGLPTLLVAAFFFVAGLKGPPPIPEELNVAMPLSIGESHFLEVGPATEFLQTAIDDEGRHFILGRTDRGNGVPWIAEWSSHDTIGEPIILSSSDGYRPVPEVFAIASDEAVYVQNKGVDEDKEKVFDETVHERRRYYEFARWSFFETRAELTFVPLGAGPTERLTPFGALDARLTNVTRSPQGFVAGGYVVPEGTRASYPALVQTDTRGKPLNSFVFKDGFGEGSHWIDDVHPIESDRFLVVGRTTVARGAFIGWIGSVDVASGELRRIGETFDASGQTILQPTDGGYSLVTESQVLRIDETGHQVWRLGYAAARGPGPFDQFDVMATAATSDGGLWIAGTVAGGEWVAWLAKVSSMGEAERWSQWGSFDNSERIVGLVPDRVSGGVDAFGVVLCRGPTQCGSIFARGFVLGLPSSGGLNESTLDAFFDYAKNYERPKDISESDPELCSDVDMAVCLAVQNIPR
ncbi:MAG: hypothetical protein ABJI00_01630 [Paracoccaceae bacterium]